MVASRSALKIAFSGFLLATSLLAQPSWSRPSVNPYSETELRAVESGDEAKIRSLRKEEITQLRIALGRHAPTNRRADLYLRLAEIYIEAYRADYLLEGRVHEKRIEKGETDPRIDHAHSDPSLRSGIEACKEILNLGIRFDKMDRVYYFLGFNYSELGDRKTGLQYFTQLTQKFPKSPFVGEAYKELGESAFNDGDYRKAQTYLEQAIRRATPESLPRVYHRLAWCYYRLKMFDRSVETMKQAIDASQKSGEKFLSLREEAFRDLALFMTESGKVDEAIAYFEKTVQDKNFYPEVLEKLGKQYERNVEPAKATQVYESLLKTNPNSEAGFRVRVKLVDLDLRRGRFKDALARLDGVVIPKNSTDGSIEGETQTAAQNLRAMIRRTATENHEKFRKNSERAHLDIAESYYTAYLKTFLSQSDPRNETPEIQMYLAEVKRELGKSKEASDLYRGVLSSKDKRYAKEAGALWTASLSEALRKQVQKGGSSKANEPSAMEQEFVEAADGLNEALGDTNEGREAALRAAEVLAGYKDTQKDSKKRIRKIIERAPQTAQAQTAARLWLQLATDANDQDELEDAIKEIRGNSALMAADQKAGGKLRTYMTDQDTRVRIGQINKEEKNKDFSAAGREYESFGNDSSNRETAEKSYANAVSSYLKTVDADGFERVSAAWLKRYPKSPMGIEALRGAATSFLIAGRFDVTARTFERLGREAGDADSLVTAARVYEGTGDTARAERARIEHIKGYPSNPNRGMVALELARSQDAARQDRLAVQSYKICMSASPELFAECGSRLGDLYLRNRDIENAKSMYRKVGGSRSTAAVKSKGKKKKAEPETKPTSTEESSPFVGYARYKLAVLIEQKSKFAPLVMPEAQLKKAMNQRLEFLEPLSRAYSSAVEAGGPWAIAALDRLATWVLNFADDVDRIAPPPQAVQAGAEAVERFRKNLKSVSNPLRAKAVDAWLNAYTKALAAESFSPALPGIADRLADAHVDAPVRAQGFRGRLRLAGVPADGGEQGKNKAFSLVRERLGRNYADSTAWVDYGNLLWGDGKPLLARIAYERALSLNGNNPSALNNRGVVLISSEGEEDWQGVLLGSLLFQDALKRDEFFIAAKMNRAALLNYYRLFEKAKKSWEQVLAKYDDPDVRDGLGVALAGVGQTDAAQAQFKKATDAGASTSRFVVAYHDAARLADTGDKAKCQSRLDSLDMAQLPGFEKTSVEHLKKTCSVAPNEGNAQ